MFSIEEITLYVLLGVNILFALWLMRLEIKIRNIGEVKDKKELKNKINFIKDRLETMRKSESDTADNFRVIEEKLKDNIRNIEIIRFNPFKDDGVGGDQSFAAALLNGKGDGIVISSLYAREKVSVFAKPVKNWQSKYELLKEEEIVLEKTKENRLVA